MFRKLAFSYCLFSAFSASCQDSSKFALGASISYHPQDLFFHVHGQLDRKNLVQDIFLGFGTLKTISSKQFMPSVGYDLGYKLKLGSWFFATPFIRLAYYNLNVKIPSKHPFIHTTECFLAARFTVGKKNQLALGGGIGPAIEWKYDAYYQRRQHFLTWNYFAEITYYYVF